MEGRDPLLPEDRRPIRLPTAENSQEILLYLSSLPTMKRVLPLHSLLSPLTHQFTGIATTTRPISVPWLPIHEIC